MMTAALDRLRGKWTALLAFGLVAALVVGGLGWVTAAALRLERDQQDAQALEETAAKLRLALWRLDSRVSPILAREESRPYSHYSAVFAPPVALRDNGRRWTAGAVLQPSPLLDAPLPDWMLLHFQVDDSGWRSPQVLTPSLAERLRAARPEGGWPHATSERARLLARLAAAVRPTQLATLLHAHLTQPGVPEIALIPPSQSPGAPPPQVAPNLPSNQGNRDFNNRAGQAIQLRQQNDRSPRRGDPSVVQENTARNGENWFGPTTSRPPAGAPVTLTVGPLVPLWVRATGAGPDLLWVRDVTAGERHVLQGVLLDWPRLSQELLAEVRDLFPEAHLHPLPDGAAFDGERTMAALPVELIAGAPAGASGPGWTPLRAGLVLAWAAAILALAAVGLGGWSLIALSERRIRFASAVTHELRTPLTTLRLYLDMLAGGMISNQEQREEYLRILNAEAERLTRLVGNVLEFSRLENRRSRCVRTEAAVADLLAQARDAWAAHCRHSGKELAVDDKTPAGATVATDPAVLQQILGALIENACKYSQDADDPRVWLRARLAGRRLAIEVEDRGPGVPPAERRSVFRPYRRGRAVAPAGGVGLGLALARRWAGLLGGRLTVHDVDPRGACFRLSLPLEPNMASPATRATVAAPADGPPGPETAKT